MRLIINREIERTAAARCVAFAAWSELTASPHDLDPRVSLAEKQGIGSTLPYAAALDELLREIRDADLHSLKREYSGLFEVGNDGPPVPIREDLQTGQRSGTREDLVRFYNYFDYRLDEKFAWAPDHLSVELEFMHFLCYQEASVDDNANSYQLAQFDFTERHLQRWIPGFADRVAAVSDDAFYVRVMRQLSAFIAADSDWQKSTLSITEDE